MRSYLEEKEKKYLIIFWNNFKFKLLD
jgi:hypothetical protein